MSRYRLISACLLVTVGLVVVYAETKEPADGPELAKVLYDKYGVVCDSNKDGKIVEAIVDGNDVKDVRGALARLGSVKSLQRIVATTGKLDRKTIQQLTNLPSLEHLSLVCDMNNDDLEPLQNLKSLKSLTLDGAPISDSVLIYLKPLKLLEQLSLYHTKINGSGFSNLELLPLQSLHLGFTPITDESLVAIGKIKTLRTLDLHNTRISDAGLLHLTGLYQLFKLSVAETKVTHRGTQAFVEGYGRSRKEADSSGLLPKKHPQLEVIAH